MAVAVRGPPHGHGARHPHRAVLGAIAPFTVIVQVLVADDVARDVARRARVVPAAVTAGAPVFPGIWTDRVVHVVRGGVAAYHYRALIRVHWEGGAGGGHFGVAAPHGDGGRVPAGIDVHAIRAGAEQGDGAAGRVDLEALVIPQVAYPHVERALRQPHLHGAIIERQEAERSLRREAERTRAHRDLGARVRVGPQMVSIVEWVVDRGLVPVDHVAGSEGHRAREEADPADAARGVLIGSVGPVPSLEGWEHCQEEQRAEGAGDAHGDVLLRHSFSIESARRCHRGGDALGLALSGGAVLPRVRAPVAQVDRAAAF